jgi:DNA processing protein
MGRASLSDWVALNLLRGLGPVLLHRLLERFGDPGLIAFGADQRALEAVPGMGEGRARSVLEERAGLRRRAEAEVRACASAGVRILTLEDSDYPVLLREIPDPPPVLYLAGELESDRVRIAVVGSRRPTAYGNRVAKSLAARLAERGVEIVSGGARGIDARAHEAALEAGGRTVAVLGSGLARPYPKENEPLFARIRQAGALVSEFPLDTPPKPEHFPRRNRLIAALSSAVVVVEAAARSGSLSTAAHALEQGREVMAVPGPVDSDRSVGCHRLIQQGAKLVHDSEDVIAELRPELRSALGLPPGGSAREGSPNLDDLSEEEAFVLSLLADPEPVHLDVLVERARLDVARLQVALFGLEMRGAVEQLPGRYYLARLFREA